MYVWRNRRFGAVRAIYGVRLHTYTARKWGIYDEI
jgi:hypothetical protein